MTEEERDEAVLCLDAIIANLREGYPDLVDMEPSESFPAAIAANALRVRDLIMMRPDG